MLTHEMQSHIFFIHTPEEVAELEKAVIPMAEYIAAVGTSFERGKLKVILGGKYFRVKEARAVHGMLLRACKYARARLADYFEIMQPQILVNSQILENAANAYWNMFQRLREETMPVH